VYSGEGFDEDHSDSEDLVKISMKSVKIEENKKNRMSFPRGESEDQDIV
jgi:hypothetical protein